MLMRYAMSVLAVVLLAACSQGEVKENLGLVREAPDEFRVVSRPPLSVPKEFYLVPPTPGAEPAFGLSAEGQARDLVTGGRADARTLPLEQRQNALADTAAPVVTTAPLASSAEENFLRRAGTDSADPAIRGTLAKERAAAVEEEPDMLDRLRGDGDGDPVVDAGAEKQRLEANKKANKPAAEGDVPVVDPKKKSTLERLFE